MATKYGGIAILYNLVPVCIHCICQCWDGNCPPGGWSGGAMVLGKLPVPGSPAYLD